MPLKQTMLDLGKNSVVNQKNEKYWCWCCTAVIDNYDLNSSFPPKMK